MVGLFLVAALAVSATGCGNKLNDNECYDENEDGYCDDDGNARSSGYYYSGGRKVYYKSGSPGITNGVQSYGSSSSGTKPNSSISSGASGSNSVPKGGIGSSSGSSSGG
ncbi:hypothetical protein FE781_15330 [Paenibacillus thermoaerophilus]|nr:hypothetical protein FE781_15330 [Paenibacillus thermoaerophilus]